MNGNEEHLIQSVTGPLSGQVPLQMRGPADMAEMLPYLLGFFPDDSVVAVGLQGPMLQQGGVIRLDIPTDPADWPSVAADTARLLVTLSGQRDRPPEQVLLYLCRDAAEPAAGVGSEPGSGPGSGPGGGPGSGGPVDGPGVLAGLRPLAEQLAQAFRAAGVLVKESLLVSDGRWWSFLCGGESCCDPAGVPIRSVRLPSPIAAAAAFAGVAPRGSRKAIAAGLIPVGPPEDAQVREAIGRAGPQLIHELSGPGGRLATLERTGVLLAEVLAEFGTGACELDRVRTARLLVGLQDKLARDRAAEYAEPDELIPAQRLWRYLARQCVPPFEHYAAPPLTLLAWTSWLAGDTATARVVLSRVLDLDQGYTLAQLLYESLNGGLHPSELHDRVRQERRAREQLADLRPTDVAVPPDDPGPSAMPPPPGPPTVPTQRQHPPAPPGGSAGPADQPDRSGQPGRPRVPRQAGDPGRSGRPSSSRQSRRKARRSGRRAGGGGGPAYDLPEEAGPFTVRVARRAHRPHRAHRARRAR
ncbi:MULTISPECIES: DUF4192 domain-containing protein [unclassified Kitasatospora]|uniref:DUF4192 domain-containing protein n=1 Tax=unclassified Kitasatospora TaxID=2633591 RepID=UPI000709EA9A|nr:MULTISPECIES: DUF4192 domain-containing protein [unclassified Kitasatospora]KQV21259.1 hypothetical protein ASC99_19725 [Kitasatospora sp. Root107]KRB69449.1 hypothetical protein ASE03_27160 [Kitasatospora sp. Root187]